MVGNIGRSSGKAPSSGVSKLAGLLAEIKALTPKELTRIEKTTLEYHAARNEASERIAEADRKQAELAEAEASHAAHVRTENAALDGRQEDVSSREGRCTRREQEVEEWARKVKADQTSVADRERRLHRQAAAALEGIEA